ncbi:nucleotide-diphospho-sugar transferase [Entophlyctis helioformis]|nr:nucleotide-diphospho-sugar transferase [Entophlyctis helioformis]
MTFAYVTLLTSESYLPGALVLARSLRRTSTPHPLVVLVTPDVGAAASAVLARVYDVVTPVDALHTTSAANLALLGRPDLGATFTKLHVFDPAVVPYDRIVFLDADTLVRRNVDGLFASLDGPSTTLGSDGSTTSTTSTTTTGSTIVFAAAPDVGWPDCFNSGVFVARPGAQLYQDLRAYAATYGSFDGGDQGVLNGFFSSWSSEPAYNPRTARLPFIFNVTPSAYYTYLPAFARFSSDIAIVHFIGDSKPWRWSRFPDGSIIARGSTPSHTLSLIREWWAVFDDFRVHTDLAVFNLDRNWANYTPPNTAQGQGQGQSSQGYSNHNGHHANGSPQPEFATYRANWDEREIRPPGNGNGSRSRSVSPTKGQPRVRSPDKEFASRPSSASVSPVTATAGLLTTTLQRPPSPTKAASSQSQQQQSQQQYQQQQTSTRVSVTTQDSSQVSRMESTNSSSSDLGNYRVGWDPKELRGQNKSVKKPSPVTGTFSSPTIPSQETYAQDSVAVQTQASNTEQDSVGRVSSEAVSSATAALLARSAQLDESRVEVAKQFTQEVIREVGLVHHFSVVFVVAGLGLGGLMLCT